MEANRNRARWSWSEFARLPTSGSTRYEVIGDELVVTPSPTSRHQRIVGRLLAALHVFVRAHDLGEVFPGPLDVLFAEGDYFQPDLLFVRKDRAHLVSDRGVEGPPDLVIEIVSPSTEARDRGIKLERYRLFDVPEYWVVDPDAGSIEVWDLAAGAEKPVVLGAGEALRWTPEREGPTLRIEVAEILDEP